MLKKSEPSLAEVQQAFAQWRRERPTYSVPPELRAQAVRLLAAHRVSEVMQALRLDQRRISRWRREQSSASAAPSGFIEVPPAPPAESSALALTLTRQAVDGSSVSIAAELNAAQWRWALAMLKEVA